MAPPKNQSLLQPTIRRAFTLVELLVVIAIIIVIAAVAMPSMNAILRGNAAKQGSNMVSAFLTSARAIAMSNHRRAGVIFYEDPVNKNQTAVMICLQVPGNVSQFTGVPNRGVDYLPRGVRVGVLDDKVAGGEIGTEQASFPANLNIGTTRPRLILFEGTGQMVMAGQLSAQPWTSRTYQVGDVVYDPSQGTYVCLTVPNPRNPQAEPFNSSPPTIPLANNPQWAQAPWNLNDTNGNAIGFSSPGVMIYDRADYDAAGLTTDLARSNWLQQNGIFLVVNSYTGAVVR